MPSVYAQVTITGATIIGGSAGATGPATPQYGVQFNAGGGAFGADASILIDPTAHSFKSPKVFTQNMNALINPTQFTGADLGAQINAAIAAQTSPYITIQIPARTSAYTWSTQVTIDPRNVSITGVSSGSVYINCTASPCLNVTESSFSLASGGIIGGFTLNGSGATNQIGIQSSGVQNQRWDDITFTGFGGVGSVSWYLYNSNATNGWQERIHATKIRVGGGTGLKFAYNTSNAAAGSFGYSDFDITCDGNDFNFTGTTPRACLQVVNGRLYGSDIKIQGNIGRYDTLLDSVAASGGFEGLMDSNRYFITAEPLVLTTGQTGVCIHDGLGAKIEGSGYVHCGDPPYQDLLVDDNTPNSGGANLAIATANPFASAWSFGTVPNFLGSSNTGTSFILGGNTDNPNAAMFGMLTGPNIDSPFVTIHNVGTNAFTIFSCPNNNTFAGIGACTVVSDITAAGLGVFNNVQLTGITGSSQCLQVSSTGLVSGTGAACGAGGGTVTTVSAGNLAGIFTSNTTNQTTTPQTLFTPVMYAAHSFFGNTGGSLANPVPSFIGTQDESPQEYAASDTGTANAYIVSVVPNATSLVAGLQVWWTPANNNTGASTLNVNGLGAKNILVRNGSALQGADIATAQICHVIYDGTQWELQNPVQGYATQWRGVIGPATTTVGGIYYLSATGQASLSAALTSGQFVLAGGTGAPTATFSIVPAANGGTGISTSASTGLPMVAAGVWTVSATQALPNGTTATTQASTDATTKIATDAFVKATESGIFTHTLTGATPVAVNTSTTVASVDVQYLTLSANVTSFTLPTAAATADGQQLRFQISQGTAAAFTLPTGTAGSPFTAGTGSTLVNTVPGGCPTIGTTFSTTAPSQLFAVLQYSTTLTQWTIVGCQLGNTAQKSVTEWAINAGNAAFGNGTSFPATAVIASTTAVNAGHFTNLTANMGSGTCTTGAVINIFDGTTNTGTSMTLPTAISTKGTQTAQAQTLTFAAGDVIGIYVTTVGATCTTAVYQVSAQIAEP